MFPLTFWTRRLSVNTAVQAPWLAVHAMCDCDPHDIYDSCKFQRLRLLVRERPSLHFLCFKYFLDGGSLTRTNNVQVCNISFDFKALGSWIVRSAYEQVTCWSHVTDFGEEGLKLAKLSRNEVYEMGGRTASPSISGRSHWAVR